MLTRNDIDERIKTLNEKIVTSAPAGQVEQALLITLGLDLLGNFLGDISDIALNNRRQHEDCLAYKAKMGLDEALR